LYDPAQGSSTTRNPETGTNCTFYRDVPGLLIVLLIDEHKLDVPGPLIVLLIDEHKLDVTVPLGGCLPGSAADTLFRSGANSEDA
jgi:hypothetical protein